MRCPVGFSDQGQGFDGFCQSSSGARRIELMAKMHENVHKKIETGF